MERPRSLRRTETNGKELQASMAQLSSPRCPAREHHAGGAAPHPRPPLSLGKSVVENSAVSSGKD
ncbi:hypothetical protein BHE74_00034366 [Ensete ventricosum]|nr:hypothetical protein BHE74_00034366 [Ensete ventricosum]RZS05374.1 hypothetical protein BHM03_00035873 [Ensete ventricosum]